MKSEGFTLIELLVVITISALFFGSITINFARQQREYEFDAALNDTKAIIELARSKAVNVEIPSTCTGTGDSYDNFKGYAISYAADPPSITMSGFCDTSDQPVKVFDLSKYTGLDIVYLPGDFYFEKVSGVVKDKTTSQLISSNSLVRFKSDLKQGNQCGYLEIDSHGIIRTNFNEACP